MATVEQLQAEVDELSGQVKQMRDLLGLLQLNGLNDAFDGSGNQTFGGGIIRLDRHGAQMKKAANPAAGSRGFTAYYFLGDFSAEPGFAANRGYLDGVVDGTGTVTSVTSIYGSSAVDGTGGTIAGVFVSALASGANYILIRPTLFLDPQTADPAVFGDGMLWYRSDTTKLKARINGVSENVATEAYVASSGATVKTEQMVTPWSWCSLGVQLAALARAAPATSLWPTANKAIYVPFTLDESTTFTKAFWFNGAAVSGNVDVGIYNEAGTKQVSIGSTAQATTNVIQEVNIADTTLAAGRYYMALACDNTTAQFFSANHGTGADSTIWNKGLGIAEQTSAFALPATATFATSSANYIPFFGFSIRTLVV